MKESPNRQAIVRLLEANEREHLSATTVHHRLAVKGHKIALSTVYSNLDALANAGLIGEVYSEGERLFERRAAPHPHLICGGCGEVQDLAPDALSEACLRDLEAQASALGWRLEPRQLTLVGRCPQCQTSQATKLQPSKGAQ